MKMEELWGGGIMESGSRTGQGAQWVGEAWSPGLLMVASHTDLDISLSICS